jgi:hypothetical protein
MQISWPNQVGDRVELGAVTSKPVQLGLFA